MSEALLVKLRELLDVDVLKASDRLEHGEYPDGLSEEERVAAIARDGTVLAGVVLQLADLLGALPEKPL